MRTLNTQEIQAVSGGATWAQNLVFDVMANSNSPIVRLGTMLLFPFTFLGAFMGGYLPVY